MEILHNINKNYLTGCGTERRMREERPQKKISKKKKERQTEYIWLYVCTFKWIVFAQMLCYESNNCINESVYVF